MDAKKIAAKDLVWLVVFLSVSSILIFSFMARSDGKMFEFLGLAGTIISIVLAVVAIFYSFLQNFSSQRLEGDMRQLLAKMDERTTQLLSLTAKLENAIVANNRATADIGRKVDALLPSGKLEIVKSQRIKDLDEYLQEAREEVLDLLPDSKKDSIAALLEQQKLKIMKDVKESDLKERILATLASGGRYADSDEWSSFYWLGGQTADQIYATLLRVHNDGEPSLSTQDVKRLLDEMLSVDLISKERWATDRQLHYFIREHDAPSQS